MLEKSWRIQHMVHVGNYAMIVLKNNQGDVVVASGNGNWLFESLEGSLQLNPAIPTILAKENKEQDYRPDKRCLTLTAVRAAK